MKLLDPHCHILPYVDDGARNLDEALDMLQMQAQQGVATVVLTPHLRTHMFETPKQKILEQYRRLRMYCAQDAGLPDLYLGREYFCDENFLRLMMAEPLQTLGNSGFLLMEFSSAYEVLAIELFARQASHCGYQPVIAHAERYACFQHHPDELNRVLDAGAWVQINASSVLGEEGRTQKKITHDWLKNDMVHLVASDSHRRDGREPNLGKAHTLIDRKFGHACAKKIFEENPEEMRQKMR